jgi:hypothetical protein
MAHGAWANVALFALFGQEEPTHVRTAGLLGPVVDAAHTGLASVLAALLSAAPKED